MRSEFLRQPPRNDERVRRVHAARDHADEQLVRLRFWPRRVFILQYLRRAILMHDGGFHHRGWLGEGARA